MKFKNLLITGVSSLVAAALAVGGTVAYLSNSDSDVNVMAAGNVKIEQIEQQRKVGADGNSIAELEAFEQTKGMYPVTKVFNQKTEITVDNGLDGDAKKTKTLKFADNKYNFVDKIVTVKNTGENDAYIRTLFAFEMLNVDGKWVDPIGTDVMTVECGGADGKGITRVRINNELVTIEVGGTMYSFGTYYYTSGSMLIPGETSLPSLAQVYLDSDVGNEFYDQCGGYYDILVISQAAQVEGFANAQEALDTAFGEVTAENAKDWFTGMTAEVVDNAADLNAALADGGNVVIDGTVEQDEVVDYGLGDNYAVNFAMSQGGTLTGGTIVADDNTEAFCGLFLNSEIATEWIGNGKAITVEDVTVNANLRTAITAQAITNDITLNDVTVNNNYGIGVYGQWDGANVILNDCTVTGGANNSEAKEWQKSAVAVETGADMVVNSGTYTGKYAAYVMSTGGTITINGGTFNGELKVTYDANSAIEKSAIVINGGTFSVDPSGIDGVTVNGTVINNENGTYTVK